MARNQLAWLLTVNTGSSSLKASLYPLYAPALGRAELTAAVTAIGSSTAELRGLGATAAAGRLITAHLGNGASMAAVLGGASVDTTMGFTPAGGLVMSTRTGDLAPGVLAYLLQTGRVRADDVNALVNRRSGLLAVAGGNTGNMGELLGRGPVSS